MSGPSFDMLHWVFAHVTAETLRAVAGPSLDRDEAEAQASMLEGHVLGVAVMFLADRSSRASRGLPPVDF